MAVHGNEEIRAAVRDRYGKIAAVQGSGCGCSSTGACCGGGSAASDVASSLGYDRMELTSLPDGANLGLGCGNPQAIASIRPGEVIVDLGSGGGVDCFLAARASGHEGRVIGVDMTAEMVALARRNAAKAGYDNVEFRLGEIEHLPVADASVDVIISNCVINLSPEKPQVFREAHRILKRGGRLAVSDVVAVGAIPEEVRSNLDLYAGCVAGASAVAEIEEMLRDAGFVDIDIRPRDESRSFVREWQPGMGVEDYALSATIQARKP